jgi:hypothetical protein
LRAGFGSLSFFAALRVRQTRKIHALCIETASMSRSFPDRPQMRTCSRPVTHLFRACYFPTL